MEPTTTNTRVVVVLHVEQCLFIQQYKGMALNMQTSF